MENNVQNEQIFESLGNYDPCNDLFFDLTIFKYNNYKKLTNLTIYLTNDSNNFISALELYYDNISSGILKGKTLIEISDCILKEIKFLENEFLIGITGSILNGYITNLSFLTNIGNEYTIHNELNNKLEKILVKKIENNIPEEIKGFNFSYGKFLTYITPIYRISNYEIIKDTYARSIQMGKKFNDSTLTYFNYNSLNELHNDREKLKQIKIYHDNSLVKGYELIYTKSIVKVGNSKGHLCEQMALNDHEKIIKIAIRAGDLIDYIAFYTNKDHKMSAGSCTGGALLIFDFEDLDNFTFSGFESGNSNNLHFIKLIFLK